MVLDKRKILSEPKIAEQFETNISNINWKDNKLERNYIK